MSGFPIHTHSAAGPGRLRHHEPDVRAANRGGHWKATLFVDNLFDRRYAAGLNNSIANCTWSPKAPDVARAVNTTQWLPPRDWHRYVGMRADATF